MAKYDNQFRLSTAQALAVASVGGAAASSSAFGTQTYVIQLAYPGSTSSTGGCRIAIVSPNDSAVSSTNGTLLPPNTIGVFRCSPGQRVSAISNDAGTFSLSITELTD
jgi:hypothetical protein